MGGGGGGGGLFAQESMFVAASSHTFLIAAAIAAGVSKSAAITPSRACANSSPDPSAIGLISASIVSITITPASRASLRAGLSEAPSGGAAASASAHAMPSSWPGSIPTSRATNFANSPDCGGDPPDIRPSVISTICASMCLAGASVRLPMRDMPTFIGSTSVIRPEFTENTGATASAPSTVAHLSTGKPTLSMISSIGFTWTSPSMSTLRLMRPPTLTAGLSFASIRPPILYSGTGEAGDASRHQPTMSLFILALSQYSPPVSAPVWDTLTCGELRGAPFLTEPLSGTYA